MAEPMFIYTAIPIKKCENDKVEFARGANVPSPDKCPNPVSMYCPQCTLHFCAAHGGNHGHLTPAPAAEPEPAKPAAAATPKPAAPSATPDL